MTNIEKIENKVSKLSQLKNEIWEIEKSLKEDLTQLDRDAFNGLTWYEFLDSINELVNVNDKISIKRDRYRLYGIYHIDENVTLNVSGNIYFNDDRFKPMVEYKESGRSLNSVPKKYEKQYEEMKAEMRKFQFERPSDKYSKEFGITLY